MIIPRVALNASVGSSKQSTSDDMSKREKVSQDEEDDLKTEYYKLYEEYCMMHLTKFLNFLKNQQHAHDKSGHGFVNGCYSMPSSSNVKACFIKKVIVVTL